MFRRILCILTVLILLPAIGLAQSFSMAGFDGQDSTRFWESNDFFNRMNQRTGISFTFDQYTDAAKWQAAKDAMFAPDGQLPDVLFKASLTSDELIRYTDSGQLIDLMPLLEQHAPNLWALLTENPEWLRAITLPNGKIGALPMIQAVSTQNIMWINQDWLTALNLEMPTDMASLREVLIAFRDRDPNGNYKADEIPMLFLGPWELKMFSHAYGVVVNDYNLYLDQSGKVCFWPLEDSFVTFLEDVHGLYADKLLDPDGFSVSDSLRLVTEDDATNTYGAFFAPTPLNLLPYNLTGSYVLLEPLVYEGQQIYRDLFGPLRRGTFAITSACSDPAAVLSWVDTLYTEEGAIEAMAGTKDVHYTVDGQGYWHWSQGDMEQLMLTSGSLSIVDTGEMPILFPKAFNNSFGEEGVRRITLEADRLTPFLHQPFPYYTLTPEQRQQVNPLQQELGRYVDVSIGQFVTGEVPINETTIAEFRAGLIQRGADEMIAFWQGVADTITP